MKWILRLLGLVGILVLLAVILGVYLTMTFDPNAYKDRIEAKVAEVTGRELTLAGSIELTLFPSLGLRLEDARLANAEGFAETPFAEVRVVDVAVAVLPLIRGEIEVQRIEADGVSVYLARDARGRSNWDDLVERAEQSREEAVEDVGNAGPARPQAVFGDIQIAGLEVTNLRLEWDDRQAGTRMVLAPLNLVLRGFRPGMETPLSLDGSMRIEEENGAPVEMDLKVTGLLNVDPVANRYALRRVESTVDLRHPALEPEVNLRLETDLVLDLRDSVARVERLSAHLSDLHLTGLIEARGIGGEALELHAELRSNTFNPRTLLDNLGLPVPDTTDPDVFRRMAIDLSLSGGAERLTVNPLLITLDDSSLRGEGGVDLSGPRPMINFELQGDRLNLDRYLPPEVEQARIPEVPGEVAEADIPIDLPTELLRSFDIDGNLGLSGLTLFGLTLEGIEMKLRARDGEWRMEPLTGSGYEGRLESHLTVDARRDIPRYAARVRLENIAIGALLEALRQEESRLLGTGNLSLEIDATGASVDALTASLNGTGEMRFTDGAVRGINIARIVRHADARLRGEPPEDDGEPDQTDFSELSGSFRIEDGVVRNDDLVASSPLLRAGGRGSADLPEQTMDYRVDATLVATIEGQSGRSLEELRGVNLPIRITGTFSEPRFRLNLEDVVRERVDERVRRETDRLQQRLFERLGVDAPDGPNDSGADQSEPSGSGGLDEVLDQLRDRGRSLFR